MKWFIVLLLTFGLTSGETYSVRYDYTKRNVYVYWVVNHTDRYMFCEVIGEEYYYNEFEIKPNGTSRQHRVPNESVGFYCG